MARLMEIQRQQGIILILVLELMPMILKSLVG
jgi:hypothetical protein